MSTLLTQVGHLTTLTFASLLFSMHAAAQATRTWASGVGDDVNPSSRRLR